MSDQKMQQKINREPTYRYIVMDTLQVMSYLHAGTALSVHVTRQEVMPKALDILFAFDPAITNRVVKVLDMTDCPLRVGDFVYKQQIVERLA